MRAVRVALVIGLVLVLQVAVMPHLRIAGVAPDLLLVLTIAVAVRLGPEAGALTGFAAGLAFDLFLETPLGLGALADALVGYGAGVFVAGLLRVPRGLPLTLAAVGGLAGGFVFLAVGTLAGSDAVHGWHGVQTVVLAAAYDALVAPAIFGLVALVLRTPRTSDPWAGAPMLRR